MKLPWQKDAKRQYFYDEEVNKAKRKGDAYTGYTKDLKPVPEERGNLIGSLTDRGTHMPVIDLDFPCRLVESSTPGHFHLYIDKEVGWNDYSQVLAALNRAGLTENGWTQTALESQCSFVRKPGTIKAQYVDPDFERATKQWEEALSGN